MSAPSTSGLSVIKSYCYKLSTLNKVYFTNINPGHCKQNVIVHTKKNARTLQTKISSQTKYPKKTANKVKLRTPRKIRDANKKV